MSKLLIVFILLIGCVFAQHPSIGLFELYAPVSDYCPSESDSNCTTSNEAFFYLGDDFSGFDNQFSLRVGEKDGFVSNIQLISKSNFTDEQLDTDVLAIVQQLYDSFVNDLAAPNFAVERISEAITSTSEVVGGVIKPVLVWSLDDQVLEVSLLTGPEYHNVVVNLSAISSLKQKLNPLVIYMFANLGLTVAECDVGDLSADIYMICAATQDDINQFKSRWDVFIQMYEGDEEVSLVAPWTSGDRMHTQIHNVNNQSLMITYIKGANAIIFYSDPNF